jgi:RNA polymerase sigma-70 factor (ECF subfamily)
MASGGQTGRAKIQLRSRLGFLTSSVFRSPTIRQPVPIVVMAESMSKPGASIPVRTASPKSTGTCGEELVCAFNEVRTELVSTLYFILGNYEDAQDAVQEAFLKCWRGLDGMEEVRNLRGWIFRVGVNAAKDLQRNAWRRRARPLTRAGPQAVSNGQSPHAIAEDREDQRRLQAALFGLRPEEQEVYLLRMNGCLTYEEIAELRRSPVGTVKTQMRAAIAKLRQVLGEK